MPGHRFTGQLRGRETTAGRWFRRRPTAVVTKASPHPTAEGFPSAPHPSGMNAPTFGMRRLPFVVSTRLKLLPRIQSSRRYISPSRAGVGPTYRPVSERILSVQRIVVAAYLPFPLTGSRPKQPFRSRTRSTSCAEPEKCNRLPSPAACLLCVQDAVQQSKRLPPDRKPNEELHPQTSVVCRDRPVNWGLDAD
jgi:hypothetical protein